jgi:hypothetical protein
MYISFDDGDSWQPFQLNLPITPVTDLLVHEQDLVVATQGRSFWILDDLTPLHEITDVMAAAPAHLFSPRAAIRSAGRGARPAVIFYYFAEKPDADVTLEILDAGGSVVRTFTGRAGAAPGGEQRGGGPSGFGGAPRLSASAGMNRFVWNLQYEPPELIPGSLIYIGYRGGPFAVPGSYTVRLTSGDWRQDQPLEVLGDPRRPDVSRGELAEQFELEVQLRDLLTASHAAIKTIRSIREQAMSLAQLADEAGMGSDLLDKARALDEKLTAVEEQLVQTKSEGRQDPINFPPMLDNQIGYLYRYVAGGYGKPTRAAYDRHAELAGQLDCLTVELDMLITLDLAEFNAQATELSLGGVILPKK